MSATGRIPQKIALGAKRHTLPTLGHVLDAHDGIFGSIVRGIATASKHRDWTLGEYGIIIELQPLLAVVPIGACKVTCAVAVHVCYVIPSHYYHYAWRYVVAKCCAFALTAGSPLFVLR